MTDPPPTIAADRAPRLSIRRLAAALALAALLLTAGCGTGSTDRPLSLRADPSLFPRYSPAISDYVVRCAGSNETSLSVTARGSTRVSVAGRVHHGSFYVNTRLKPRQQVELAEQFPSRRTYHVRCLPADFPRWTVTRVGRPQAQWYAVTTGRIGMTKPEPNYAAVFDNRGVPVWWMRRSPPALNATVLGHGVFAWATWDGRSLGSDPHGAIEFVRPSGAPIRTLRTVDSPTDFHELQRLANGNYLVDTYVPRDHVDLRRYGGPRHATVLDGEVQELTPAGRLVWSWSSRGHIALAETGRWWREQVIAQPVQLADGRKAYDIVHLNGVAIDGRRVLVSFRHLDAVYAIDRASGRIAWKLGGTRTARSLALTAPRGQAANFGGLHNIRRLRDGTLTIHDNGTGLGRGPRAVRVRIDPARRTARVIQQITDPYSRSSRCCGSATRLPAGDWVMAWGGTPDVVETSPGGAPRLRIHFAGTYFTYRAFPLVPGRMSAARLRAAMDRMAPR